MTIPRVTTTVDDYNLGWSTPELMRQASSKTVVYENRNPSDPPTPEQAMLALAPKRRFRAGGVSPSTGNVTAVLNLLGSDKLTLGGGTLAAPAKDPLAGGALSLNFTGSQWLDHDAGAAATRARHDGTGWQEFHFFTPTSLAAISVIASSLGSPRPGSQLYINTNGSWSAQTDNETVNIAQLTSAAGALTVNTPVCISWAYGEGLPSEDRIFTNGVLSASGNTTLAPATGVDGAPFRLAAQTPVANFPARMRWYESVMFDRVLSASEMRTVFEYGAAEYGTGIPA